MSKIQKKVVESSIYTFIGSNLTLLLGLLNVFFIARLLPPEEWAIIILALLFISITGFVANFFPPAAEGSFQYYIPQLSERGEHHKIRAFIIHVYKIRLIISICIFLIFLIIIHIVNFSENIMQVIFIISPMFLFQVVSNLTVAILFAFQKFKHIFLGHFFNSILTTILISIIFFFQLENPLVLISIVYLINAIMAFIVSSIIFIFVVPFKKVNKDLSINFEEFKKIHKEYGLNLIFAGIFAQLGLLTMNLLFLTFGFVVYITFLSISQNIVSLGLKFSTSERSTHISIYSEVDSKNDVEIFESLFYQHLKYSLLIICIIVGTIYFFIEIYITLIYTEYYLVILIPIQITIFTCFSRVIIRVLMNITNSTNNTKITPYISFFQTCGNISLTLIALLFFNFTILILFITVFSFLTCFFTIFLINKITEFELKLFTIFKPFILFIICLAFVTLLFYFIPFQFLFRENLLNLIFYKIINFVVFIFIFYLFVFFTKLITKDEFKLLITIVPRLNSDKLIIKKLITIILKFLPKGKE